MNLSFSPDRPALRVNATLNQPTLGRHVASRKASIALVLAAAMLLPQWAFAQKSDAEKAAIKAGEAMLKEKFSRTPDEAFQSVVDLAAGADKEMSDGERLKLYVQAGAWDRVRELIAAQIPDIGQRLYGKIISELVYASPKSVILPMDVVKLADASPSEIDNKHIVALGRLLYNALQGTDSRAELMTLLRKGTLRLGGKDTATRKAAATLLASAELWTEAKEFGYNEKEIPRNLAIAEENPQKAAEKNWDQHLATLYNSPENEAERKEAMDGLYEALMQAAPQIAKAKLAALIDDRSQLQLATSVLAMIGKKTASAIAATTNSETDFQPRKVNLELQHFALQHLAKKSSLTEAPWQTLANLYARNWLGEAQATQKAYPTWLKASSTSRDKYRHVSIEDLARSAPDKAWLSALLPQSTSMVKTALFRLYLLSENIDRGIPYIREFDKEDPRVAAEFANAYLTTWAYRHNPNLTPEALKQYKVDTQTIVLTRIEQETCLKQLGTLLSSLDESTRKLLNQDQVVFAFDLCHSKAEIYTAQHIQDVFGSIDTLPPSLIQSLVQRMRIKLASNWRDISVQRDAATKRTTADVFRLVNAGYTEANGVSEVWLKAHPDDWRMSCLAGSLLSDWAEFAYFQSVVADTETDRFADYLKRTADAHARFRSSAKTYAAQLPKMNRADFDLLPYRSWFYGLLGIAQDTDINLRKGVTKEGLQEIRQAITALPNGTGEVHLEMFAAMVADNIQKNRIAPEMKYRYLSSAVQITGRRPTVYPAEERVQYYDSLLKEIRLQARVDGVDKIKANGHFGVFVSLVHTADIARESGGFEKYLLNKLRRTVSGKTVTEEPFYRDRFEEAMRLALADFFEVRAVIFANPNSEARLLDSPEAGGKDAASISSGAARGGWRETPLAYLHLIAKDATVDRIPPLEIELDFLDREGKVVIPVPSTPVLIEIKEDAPATRQASNIAITQIVDSRELGEQRLKMDVVATANGLVPHIRELIDLDSFALTVKQVDEREGLLIRELHNGPDGLYALSEQTWTVHLDPTPLLRGAYDRINFEFPKARKDNFQVTYRAYEDLDPVDAAATVTLREGKEAEKIAKPNYYAWGFGGFAVLMATLAVVVVAVRKGPDVGDAQPVLFTLPREITPFSVASLLHRICNSREIALSDEQKQELRRDIASLEKAAFAKQAGAHAARDIESLANRWLEVVAVAARD